MILQPTKTRSYSAWKIKYYGNYSTQLMNENNDNYSLQDWWECLTVKVKFPVKNAEIVRKFSGLASSSSQTQVFDRMPKIFIKSLFFIKLEVNDDKTGLLFVPLSTLSKPEGTHHPLIMHKELLWGAHIKMRRYPEFRCDYYKNTAARRYNELLWGATAFQLKLL